MSVLPYGNCEKVYIKHNESAIGKSISRDYKSSKKNNNNFIYIENFLIFHHN